MKKILVTGAGGLIGSEVVRHFVQMNIEVIGIDNNMRADFFGKQLRVNAAWLLAATAGGNFFQV